MCYEFTADKVRMTIKLFDIGGVLWLVAPFVFAFMIALYQAATAPVGVGSKDKDSTWAYFTATGCSIIYFFVVSFSLLRDWTWMKQIGWCHRLISVIVDIYQDRYSYWPDWVPYWPTTWKDYFQGNFVPNPTNYYQELTSVGSWGSIPFGVDGLSLGLILLTAFITPLTLIYCWRNVPYRESMCYYLLLIETLLIVAFWTRDVLVSFILFELLLWPMFRLIVVWGAHEARKKAAMSFVLYTVFGSLILLVVIIAMLLTFGTTSIDHIADWTMTESWWAALLWLPAFVAFAVTVPTWPFHHWLTLAHVEAPTTGRVVLAALLLKLGTYGLMKYILPVFNNPTNFKLFMPIVCMLCLVSVIFAAMMAISQSDLKRIVAYSRIAHMNFSLLGLLSMTDRAIMGGTILFIAHGFVSAGLFFSVGFLYDRYHQRDVLYYRGLASVLPVWSLAFTLFNLANLGVPLSFNFLGEFLIFAELINIYTWAVPLLIIALIVQVGYTIKLMSIMFGEVVGFPQNKWLAWSDLSLHEVGIALLLIVPTWYLGIRGEHVIDLLTQIDPLLVHAHHHANLTAVLDGTTDLIRASHFVEYGDYYELIDHL